VRHEFLPSSNVDGDRAGALLRDPLDFAVNRTEVMAQLPTILSGRVRAGGTMPDLVWTNRLTYEFLRIEGDADGVDAPFLDDEDFHSLDFKTALIKFFSERWMVTMGTGINFAVDTFDGVEFSDASYAGGLIFQRAFVSGWVLGFGGIYSQLTGQSKALPFLYAEYNAERYRFKLALPRSHFWYELNPTVSLGALGELDGDKFRLVKRTADLYDPVGNLLKEDVDVNLSYSRITLGPAVNVKMGVIQLRFESGYAFNRTFEFRASEEDETLRFPPGAPAVVAGRTIDYGLENGLYARVRLKFTPRLR
jgi:hypothetical protein